MNRLRLTQCSLSPMKKKTAKFFGFYDFLSFRRTRTTTRIYLYRYVNMLLNNVLCVYEIVCYEKRALRNRSHKRQYINWKCASSDFCVSRMILTLTFFTLFAYMLCVALLCLPARSFAHSVVWSVGRSFVRLLFLFCLSSSYIYASFVCFGPFIERVFLLGFRSVCTKYTYACRHCHTLTRSHAQQNKTQNIT